MFRPASFHGANSSATGPKQTRGRFSGQRGFLQGLGFSEFVGSNLPPGVVAAESGKNLGEFGKNLGRIWGRIEREGAVLVEARVGGR